MSCFAVRLYLLLDHTTLPHSPLPKLSFDKFIQILGFVAYCVKKLYSVTYLSSSPVAILNSLVSERFGHRFRLAKS